MTRAAGPAPGLEPAAAGGGTAASGERAGRPEGRHVLAAVALGLILAGAANAAEAETAPPPPTIKEAIIGGQVILDMRYRYEGVDQAGPPTIADEAAAHTLRLRLGYKTRAWHRFAALGELAAVEALGDEDYNDTRNGKTSFPVINDAEDAYFNRAYVEYAAPHENRFLLGRERINLDNERFVGSVDWRQHEQTFDALIFENETIENLKFFYAHLNNANRVNGATHPTLANVNLFGDILHVSWKTAPGTLVGYGYLFELEDSPALSHKDLGLRWAGEAALGENFRLPYVAELALQRPYADAPGTNEAEYLFLEAGLRHKKLAVRVGYEKLSGDGAYAFQTPFATLHKFNGWADVFLTTPVTGLTDLYLSLSGIVAGVALTGVYHEFDPDAAGPSHGSEIDLEIKRTWKETYTAALKYADYSANAFFFDTEKIWLYLGLKF